MLDESAMRTEGPQLQPDRKDEARLDDAGPQARQKTVEAEPSLKENASRPDAMETAVVSEEKPESGKGRAKKLALSGLLLAALAGVGWYGHDWWTDGRFLVTTDDAYVSADMAIMTPKITGYVASVPVADNQQVRAGDPIVEIDPGDYQLDLRSGEAKIATQQATMERIRAQRQAAVESVGQATANLEAQQAALDQASLTFNRAQDLARTGAGAQAALDSARNTLAQAKASVVGGNAAIKSAEANVTVLDAQITEAEHTLEELKVSRDVAARELSFTTVRAPYDGVVGNLAVQPGDLISPTRRLAAIVPLDKVYIDANFKETQLDEIRIGEKVRIEVDALPEHDLTGTVASFSPASGSVFSLLPADNATGNFTKIVQRVPVRIAIDNAAALHGALRPGLSVTVSVDTRTAPQDGTAQN